MDNDTGLTKPGTTRTEDAIAEEDINTLKSIHYPYHSHNVKRHDCNTFEHRSHSTPPVRPVTRRHPSDMPDSRESPTRARSTEPSNVRNKEQKSRVGRSEDRKDFANFRRPVKIEKRDIVFPKKFMFGTTDEIRGRPNSNKKPNVYQSKPKGKEQPKSIPQQQEVKRTSDQNSLNNSCGSSNGGGDDVDEASIPICSGQCNPNAAVEEEVSYARIQQKRDSITSKEGGGNSFQKKRDSITSKEESNRFQKKRDSITSKEESNSFQKKKDSITSKEGSNRSQSSDAGTPKLDTEKVQNNLESSSGDGTVPAIETNGGTDLDSFKTSIVEHEYLQFSLRITEDIIRNDLFTNSEMRRVFNSHIEANRGRLLMDKMKQQVKQLAEELNIPYDEATIGKTTCREDVNKAQENIENILCTCAETDSRKDCECGSVRCMPYNCTPSAVPLDDNCDCEDSPWNNRAPEIRNFGPQIGMDFVRSASTHDMSQEPIEIVEVDYGAVVCTEREIGIIDFDDSSEDTTQLHNTSSVKTCMEGESDSPEKHKSPESSKGGSKQYEKVDKAKTSPNGKQVPAKKSPTRSKRETPKPHNGEDERRLSGLGDRSPKSSRSPLNSCCGKCCCQYCNVVNQQINEQTLTLEAEVPKETSASQAQRKQTPSAKSPQRAKTPIKSANHAKTPTRKTKRPQSANLEEQTPGTPKTSNRMDTKADDAKLKQQRIVGNVLDCTACREVTVPAKKKEQIDCKPCAVATAVPFKKKEEVECKPCLVTVLVKKKEEGECKPCPVAKSPPKTPPKRDSREKAKRVANTDCGIQTCLKRHRRGSKKRPSKSINLDNCKVKCDVPKNKTEENKHQLTNTFVNTDEFYDKSSWLQKIPDYSHVHSNKNSKFLPYDVTTSNNIPDGMLVNPDVYTLFSSDAPLNDMKSKDEKTDLIVVSGPIYIPKLVIDSGSCPCTSYSKFQNPFEEQDDNSIGATCSGGVNDRALVAKHWTSLENTRDSRNFPSTSNNSKWQNQFEEKDDNIVNVYSKVHEAALVTKHWTSLENTGNCRSLTDPLMNMSPSDFFNTSVKVYRHTEDSYKTVCKHRCSEHSQEQQRESVGSKCSSKTCARKLSESDKPAATCAHKLAERNCKPATTCPHKLAESNCKPATTCPHKVAESNCKSATTCPHKVAESDCKPVTTCPYKLAESNNKPIATLRKPTESDHKPVITCPCKLAESNNKLGATLHKLAESDRKPVTTCPYKLAESNNKPFAVSHKLTESDHKPVTTCPCKLAESNNKLAPTSHKLTESNHKPITTCPYKLAESNNKPVATQHKLIENDHKPVTCSIKCAESKNEPKATCTLKVVESVNKPVVTCAPKRAESDNRFVLKCPRKLTDSDNTPVLRCAHKSDECNDISVIRCPYKPVQKNTKYHNDYVPERGPIPIKCSIKTCTRRIAERDNLLLSDQYNCGLPPHLSKYFPTISTQTNSSDFLMIDKIMAASMSTRKKSLDKSDTEKVGTGRGRRSSKVSETEREMASTVKHREVPEAAAVRAAFDNLYTGAMTQKSSKQSDTLRHRVSIADANIISTAPYSISNGYGKQKSEYGDPNTEHGAGYVNSIKEHDDSNEEYYTGHADYNEEYDPGHVSFTEEYDPGHVDSNEKYDREYVDSNEEYDPEHVDYNEEHDPGHVYSNIEDIAAPDTENVADLDYDGEHLAGLDPNSEHIGGPDLDAENVGGPDPDAEQERLSGTGSHNRRDSKRVSIVTIEETVRARSLESYRGDLPEAGDEEPREVEENVIEYGDEDDLDDFVKTKITDERYHYDTASISTDLGGEYRTFRGRALSSFDSSDVPGPTLKGGSYIKDDTPGSADEVDFMKQLDHQPNMDMTTSLQQSIKKVQNDAEQFRHPEDRRISWGGEAGLDITKLQTLHDDDEEEENEKDNVSAQDLIPIFSQLSSNMLKKKSAQEKQTTNVSESKEETIMIGGTDDDNDEDSA